MKKIFKSERTSFSARCRSKILIIARLTNLLFLITFFSMILNGNPISFQNTVTGIVTDSQSGEAMPGVNIVIKGTSAGTITDASGRYSIDFTDSNVTLVFSFIGYSTIEIPVGGRSLVNAQLTPGATSLEEVVVVGYGTQRKVTVTGSITSAKGEDIVRSPVSNISNALVGHLPGLVAIQRSGQPGYDEAIIRIRGVNTLGNNNALVVVDGIPERSLDRIDPNSIESITVLKDASAAIYGAQAANGVILVTTKRGKIGKPEITINVNQGFNQPTRIPEMTNSAEYATALNEIDTYRGWTPRYSAEDIRKFSDGSDPWRYPNTDWFAEVLKPYSNQNYMNASLRGGFDRMKYYLSLGSKFQDGYYYNSSTNYKQYDFRSNIDGTISDHVSLAFDLSGRMENRNNPTRGVGSIYWMIMRGKPNMHAFWPDGTPGPDIEYGDNPAVISTDATGYDHDKRYVFNSNLKLDIKIPWVKGLQLTGNASLDKAFQFQKTWQTPWYLYAWDGATYDANNNPILVKTKRGIEDPRLSESMQDNQNVLLNGLVNYQNNIGSKHNIALMIGMESRVGKGDEFSAYRRYFISSAIDQMFAGGDVEKTNDGSGYENARLNYFGRVNYGFSEKILFEFVWRYDGSYIFPDKGRYGFFPGVSAGWRVSEENFWKQNIAFIENFKLRASWGQTGNDRIDEWQYLSSYATNSRGYSYIFGHTEQNKLLYEARIPNPEVTWEVANQTNIGFETSLLENKISLEFDYFDNTRSNILWRRNASVPGSTGLTLPRENIGKVNNRGFEFNLGYRNQLNRLTYNVSLNGGYSKNKIVFWDEAPGAPDWQKSTGHPIPSDPGSSTSDLYYEAIGIFPDQGSIDAYPHWTSARPGDIIFKDINEDGKIDGLDMVRNDKNDIPRFTGGLNLRLGYGQFDLSVLFQGAAGAVRYIRTYSGDGGNFLKDFFDNRWTPDNPNSSEPRTFDRAEYWYTANNTHFLYKTDYIRVKNLEFGYNLPSTFSNKLGIGAMRIYLSGYNLLTLSPDLKDFDPESSNASGQQYPVQRVVNGGLTLTF